MKKPPYNNPADFRIAIIGGGASGLSACYELNKRGFNVDLYEKSNKLGGIAGSVLLSKGSIDAFYHHLFESDKYILDFLKAENLDHTIKFKRTTTGHIWNKKYYDISSLILFKKSNLLSLWGFIRFLIGGIIIKYIPTSKKNNNIPIDKNIKNLFGNEASIKIWEPLLVSKFGKYSTFIPYSWLKTRIQDRTIKLGYINNGFERIYEHISKSIKSSRIKIYKNAKIQNVIFSKDKKQLLINGIHYDRAILTTPPKVNSNILKDINYSSKRIEYIGAFCGIIEFDKRPIPSYWLGIAESNQKKNACNYSEFLAAISYAELDEEWNKSGEPTWPLYLAGYCTKNEFNKYTKEQWKSKMIKASIELNSMSNIEKISDKNVLNFKLSFAEYAQPILSPKKDLHPDPESAKFCYFANMHNIFPNDRGQNRAFFLGKKVANLIYNDLLDC